MRIVKIQRRKTCDTIVTLPEQYAKDIKGEYLQVDKDEMGRIVYSELK